MRCNLNQVEICHQNSLEVEMTITFLIIVPYVSEIYATNSTMSLHKHKVSPVLLYVNIFDEYFCNSNSSYIFVNNSYYYTFKWLSGQEWKNWHKSKDSLPKLNSVTTINVSGNTTTFLLYNSERTTTKCSKPYVACFLVNFHLHGSCAYRVNNLKFFCMRIKTPYRI